VVFRANIPPSGFWLLATFLGALVLLTHKMSSQIMIFLLLVLSVYQRAWDLLWLIPGCALMAILLSRGFYLKILVAHYDILRFWTREWPLLGADPLRESPLYGQKNYKGPARQFEPGIKNYLKRGFSILFGNYAPCVTGAVVLTLIVPMRNIEMEHVVVWLSACLLFTGLTIMIPLLRGFGFGGLYLYNGAFPAAILLGYCAIQIDTVFPAVATGVLGLNVLALGRAYLYMKKQKHETTLPSNIIDVIKNCGDGAWITFPMQLMEHLAYLANKPVLWGAHGYGFELLSQVCPVIKTDFHELKKKYNLRFVLASDSYLPDVERISIPKNIIYGGNGYHILELSEN